MRSHSGTGVVVEGEGTGELNEGSKIWDDSKLEDIKGIDANQPHRKIDLAIFNAAKSNKFIGYIIAPPPVYGVAHENLGKKVSDMLPTLVRISVQRRQAVYGGKGTNRWDSAHIADIKELYHLILEKALSERSTGRFSPDPYERFYFGSVGSFSFGDLARLIAPVLYKRKLVDSPEAVSVPPEELPPYMTRDSKAVSNRGFNDGWKPTAPTYDLFVAEEVDATLNALGL